MNRREFEQGIQDAFDGELDELRAAAIRQEMKSSPDALDVYCDQAMLEAELARHAAGRNRIPGSVSSRSVIAASLESKRRWQIALLSTAAILLLLGVVLKLMFISPVSHLAQLELSPGSQITHADGSALSIATLKAGDALNLKQGVARLRFESGVEAIIEGPATLEMVRENHLRLQGGHSWFRVPQKAIGFRVDAPQLEVIDLGTEFGIDMREDQLPQVHVLDGKVEVHSLIGTRQSWTMSAGQAAILTPAGQWRPMPTDPDKFRDDLPNALPRLRLSFEEQIGDQLAIDGEIIGVHGSTATLHNPENAILVPGIRGNAMEFLGKNSYVETDWPGISGTAPRTVAMWCRIPVGSRIDTAPPLALWGNPSLESNRKFKVALASNAAGENILRVSFGNVLFNGATPLADGNWHHLAVVYRGNDENGVPDLTAYIDGKPEAISSSVQGGDIQTDTESSESLAFSLGRYELDAGGRNLYLRAALDEFQIFAGALNEEEIRALHQDR